MRGLRWLVVGTIFGIAIAPRGLAAQGRLRGEEDADNIIREFKHAFSKNNYNLFLHGGLSDYGRFLLQDVDLTLTGQRELRGQTSFNVGGGVGFNFLWRVGARLSYTYSSTDLQFRTDIGNGSEIFDINDIGTLRSNVIAAEFMRYLLPPGAKVTPYGSIGVLGNWWNLHTERVLTTEGPVRFTDDGTEFRLGALGTIGIQARASKHWDIRLEAVAASIRNPFTGNESFRVFSGVTIDEPTRVTKTDFRLAVVYNLGRPARVVTAETPRRRRR